MADTKPAKKPAAKKATVAPTPETVVFKFERGATVKDIITGYEGVVTTQAMHLNGCIRYYLEPSTLKDGARSMGDSFDESQLEFVAPPTAKLKAATQVTAGDVTERSAKGGPAQRGEETLRQWRR